MMSPHTQARNVIGLCDGNSKPYGGKAICPEAYNAGDGENLAPLAADILMLLARWCSALTG